MSKIYFPGLGTLRLAIWTNYLLLVFVLFVDFLIIFVDQFDGQISLINLLVNFLDDVL